MRKVVGAEFGVVGAAGGRPIGVTRQRSSLLLARTTALDALHLPSARIDARTAEVEDLGRHP
jgi:hypothetical protein